VLKTRLNVVASLDKAVFAGFGAFSCPNIASGYRSQGAKVAQGGQNISSGGSCFLLPAPMWVGAGYAPAQDLKKTFLDRKNQASYAGFAQSCW